MELQEAIWYPVHLLWLKALAFRHADPGPPVALLVASQFSLVSVGCTEILP